MNQLPDCCKMELSWIVYRPEPEVIKGHKLRVIMKSGSVYECARCSRILGSCTFNPEYEYEMPILIFLNKGEKGMIALCTDCANALGLIFKKTAFERRK